MRPSLRAALPATARSTSWYTTRAMRCVAALGLVLASCGPVVIGDEPNTAGSGASAGTGADAQEADAAIDAGERPLPRAEVAVRAIGCSSCFELNAEGSGGAPPYDFRWDDGSLGARRVVCVEGDALSVSVVARDATSAESAPHGLRLERSSASTCSDAMPPTAAGDGGIGMSPEPAPLLCLQNSGFEGTPTTNFGVPELFDAVPWTTCTNPAATNTPAIVNATVGEMFAELPAATEGTTYLALAEKEQASQALCSAVPDDAALSVELDLSRVDAAGLTDPAEPVFLEMWGGLAVDCSQRELLWASGALEVGWKHFCITLRPRSFVTQLTLRANSDNRAPSPVYLLVDNLRPVDRCP